MLHWSTCNADSQRMFLARICRHVTLLNRFQKLTTHCSTANIAKNLIFRATSYHCKLALQVDQCNTTFSKHLCKNEDGDVLIFFREINQTVDRKLYIVRISDCDQTNTETMETYWSLTGVTRVRSVNTVNGKCCQWYMEIEFATGKRYCRERNWVFSCITRLQNRWTWKLSADITRTLRFDAWITVFRPISTAQIYSLDIHRIAPSKFHWSEIIQWIKSIRGISAIVRAFKDRAHNFSNQNRSKSGGLWTLDVCVCLWGSMWICHPPVVRDGAKMGNRYGIRKTSKNCVAVTPGHAKNPVFFPACDGAKREH